MKWVVQQVDKLTQPDCPLCRKHFKPDAAEAEQKKEDGDAVIEAEKTLDAGDDENVPIAATPLNALSA